MLDEYYERIMPEVEKLSALMDYDIYYVPTRKHPKECDHENVSFVQDVAGDHGVVNGTYVISGLYCNDCESYIDSAEKDEDF